MIAKTRSLLRSCMAQVFVDWGAVLDQKGAVLTYETDLKQPYSRHRPVFPIGACKPTFGPNSYIAYTASLEGAVQLESNVVIGQHSTLRADASPIRIAENSIIGDKVSMHTLELNQLVPGSIDIGTGVYIGDKAVLRCCIVDDDAYVGEGSFIAEGAIIERGAVVLPNSNVPPGAILTAGKVWAGNPVREVSDVNDKYTERVKHRIEAVKSIVQEIEADTVYFRTPAEEADNKNN